MVLICGGSGWIYTLQDLAQLGSNHEQVSKDWLGTKTSVFPTTRNGPGFSDPTIVCFATMSVIGVTYMTTGTGF